MLTLSATNSYSGTTTVSAGTLQLGLADTAALGSGGGLTANGGVLDLNANSISVPSLSALPASSPIIMHPAPARRRSPSIRPVRPLSAEHWPTDRVTTWP